MRVNELVDIIKGSIYKNLNEYIDNVPDGAQYASNAPWNDDNDGREETEQWKAEFGTYEFLFNAFKYYGELDDDISQSLRDERKYMPNKTKINVGFSYVEYSSGADEDGLADYDVDEESYDYDIDIDIFDSEWFKDLRTRKDELYNSINELLTLGVEEDIRECKSEAEFNNFVSNF